MRIVADADADWLYAQIKAGLADEISEAWFRCPGAEDAEVRFWVLSGLVLRCEYDGPECHIDEVTGDDLKLLDEKYHCLGSSGIRVSRKMEDLKKWERE